MSEQLQAPKHETIQPHESSELSRENLNKLKSAAQQESDKHSSAEKIAELTQSAKSEAISGNEMTPTEKADNAPAATFVSRELKQMALTRSLNNVRRHMNAPERVLSRVMHNKTIEKTSELAGASVARPSGMLGGGICAFLGSAILLILVRHYGYEYNYLLFSILFVGGFAVGVIGELLFRIFVRRKA